MKNLKTKQNKTTKKQPTRPAPAASTAGTCPTICRSSRTPRHWKLPSTIGLHKRPRNVNKWSTKYHIFYYISKCSSWSVDFKSSVCHFCKSYITPVFRMASKTTANYRNVPRNKNACPIFNLYIMFGF